VRRALLAALVCCAPAASAAAQDPKDGEVPMPAGDGWRAWSIHASASGVWYALVDKVVDAYGANDVVVTDDKGGHVLLTVYSGKWTPHQVVPDGQWLAPSRSADVDPRVPGRELYAAGKGGSVHQITRLPQPFGRFLPQSVEIGHAAGEEFHAVIAADLTPLTPGDELLAFGITGAVYQLVPERDGAGFAMVRRAQAAGRVRDTVVVAGSAGQPATIFGASRSGDLLAMRLVGDALEVRSVLRESSGLGRVARRTGGGTAGEVLYVTRDDGLLLRVAIAADGRVQREAIFAGPQGLRGVASGRFFADPATEAVAVYGYDKEVHVVHRTGAEPWRVDVAFAGEHQGHWLAVGELDGRNGTDELVATGFGGQVVLLARPPGYALPGAAVPAPKPLPPPVAARPPRIAVIANEEAAANLSPLSYRGGFAPKTLVYETLVRRGADGRIAPGLAGAWRIEDGGRTFVFTLREGASFHDGAAVTADDVAVHFRRWVGLPEHAWLRSNERIAAVRALGPRELRVELDRPFALLPDLCAINPTAVRAPAALDREGAFVRPCGSGPFAFVERREDGRVLRFRRHAGGEPQFVDLVRCERGQDPLDALLGGEVDAVIGSWLVGIGPARAAELRGDGRFTVVDGPGSSMLHLAFAVDCGPTQDLALRRRIAAAIDRAALVRDVERGFGDPSTGFAAPSVRCWPQGRMPDAGAAAPPIAAPLRLAAEAPHAELARAIAVQLERRGLATVVVADAAANDADLRIERTHGVPYDPHTTLVDRFLPPANARNASSARARPFDAELAARVERLCAEPDEAAREALHAAVQARLDEVLPLVPLYAPRRIAIVRRGLPAPRLDHDMYALDLEWLFAPAAVSGAPAGAARAGAPR
jgi:ABC-type transport system substrate-binding protein